MFYRDDAWIGFQLRSGGPVAGAGVGIVGVAFVFGLTTEAGGRDWVGVITAIAGGVMIVTSLSRAFRAGTPHAG